MFGFKPYNYDTFSRELMIRDFAKSKLAGGPKPGDRAPDFEGRTLEGDKIRLSDFQDERNVVLTFGSATCPFTAASIRSLNRLYNDYAGDDVAFLLVYVREAHPGEKLRHHDSWEHKLEAADLFRRQESVDIPIIVDDLQGTAHRKYGKLPNPTFIIDKSGRIAFRSLWTRASVIKQALDELLDRQQERGTDHAVVLGGEDTSMPGTYAMLHAYRALERGGSKAIDDFRHEMGMPGQMVVIASRVVSPVALNPGKALASAAIAGVVIAGGLYAGRRLRQRRIDSLRPPYDYATPRRNNHSSGEGDYAVGI